MNILEINNLNKSFDLHILKGKKITALKSINFTMREGEIIGLTGKSGSGKSSLMKCIYRTYRTSSGSIMFNTDRGVVDLAKASDHEVIDLRRDQINYCSQFLSVIPRVSALDVVAEKMIKSSASKEEARSKAAEILEQLGLPREIWDAFPVTFSGGEQQRINVARAVISNPKLLLIDEPTASLDARTKDIVIDLIRALRDRGTSVLCISHDEHTLRKLTDRTIHLENGMIKENYA